MITIELILRSISGAIGIALGLYLLLLFPFIKHLPKFIRFKKQSKPNYSIESFRTELCKLDSFFGYVAYSKGGLSYLILSPIIFIIYFYLFYTCVLQQ